MPEACCAGLGLWTPALRLLCRPVVLMSPPAVPAPATANPENIKVLTDSIKVSSQ